MSLQSTADVVVPRTHWLTNDRLLRHPSSQLPAVQLRCQLPLLLQQSCYHQRQAQLRPPAPPQHSLARPRKLPTPTPIHLRARNTMSSVIRPTPAAFAQPNNPRIWRPAFRLARTTQAARELDTITRRGLATNIAAKLQEAAHIRQMCSSPTLREGQSSRTDRRAFTKLQPHIRLVPLHCPVSRRLQ